jgi:GNAT superfamily N-acetyltransferase
MYIMDIQLEPFAQRKGLGRHLMRTLEMIARKQVMRLHSKHSSRE